MFWLFVSVVIILACAARVLLRRHRDPASRMAWLTVLFALPGIGVLAYLLLGETNIGRRRALRVQDVLDHLPRPKNLEGWEKGRFTAATDDIVEQLFRVGQSISGYQPVTGNTARLMESSDKTIDAMIADIDAAQRHVHLMFYIWLPDNNGTRFAQALMRAVERGVTVRAMVDDLGSRTLVRHPLWTEMDNAGVKLGRALRIGNPLLRMLGGRIDLRNHRKVLVIDNAITYCGSQNCADAAFLPKAKFAPWVDAVMRFEGPVVRQNQHLFAADWMASVDEDIAAIVNEPLGPIGTGFPAQVVATGPTSRHSAMPEMFSSLMYAARKTLTITTPYFVPDSMVQTALCAAARRGVATTIIFPQRCDDFAVGAASRSYYEDLLEAGVQVYEYKPGLLHTKSMTVDSEITLIGSANMDRRSFDLNYENNILLCDAALTQQLEERQRSYLNDSDPVPLAEVQNWPRHKRLWNNALAVLGPLL